jgi:hypothetical protein
MSFHEKEEKTALNQALSREEGNDHGSANTSSRQKFVAVLMSDASYALTLTGQRLLPTTLRESRASRLPALRVGVGATLPLLHDRRDPLVRVALIRV